MLIISSVANARVEGLATDIGISKYKAIQFQSAYLMSISRQPVSYWTNTFLHWLHIV